MIQSVRKAMEILDLVAVRGSIGLKELSKLLGMPKSTVCRLAQTLESSGYLYHDISTRHYFVSYKFLRVGFEVLEKSGIRECVLPVLNELALQTKETINLTVLDENMVLYVEKVEFGHIHNGIKVGARAPLHCTASGKAMLANLPEAKMYSLIKECSPLETFTKRTITNTETLLQDLEMCRNRKYAISNEEIADGVYSIGAYISHYPGREAASLSIAWPSNRSQPEQFELWGELIINACQKISNQLKCFQQI